ncbi:MAG: copper chaperone PCu(A)C [Pseudomonadota bacterium]|nr:copper chaperone PCu(A)C [Pseudomonadota bacterium]
MKIPGSTVRPWRTVLVAVFTTLAFGAVAASDFSVGDIRITHPFATPSLPGATTGAAYFGALENQGAKADKLLRASTPVAASVELHNMTVDTQGVMRMREIDGLELAPKASVKMRPGMGDHLMLIGLKKPLKEGDTFPMSLQFEHAGKVEVKVYVQTPRALGTMADMHGH